MSGLRVVLDDEGFPTHTSKEQMNCEDAVLAVFLQSEESLEDVRLNKARHLSFCSKALPKLHSGFTTLDASRPWLCYWITHSLNILSSPLDPQMAASVRSFLSHCQHPSGGFGGGPLQIPHLATSYAAVNALVSTCSPDALSVVDRPAMLKFLLSMKQANGSFVMHEGGEVDVRGSYCALNVASLLGVLTDELKAGAAEFISRCQTHEGGLGGDVGHEAHGGYTFCGLAALALLDRMDAVNMPRLLDWLSKRQMSAEGGFQGRTNKLVDGCYSWWQGGAFLVIHPFVDGPVPGRGGTAMDVLAEMCAPWREARGGLNEQQGEEWLFNQTALQEYLLLACQAPKGGMVDKPTKGPDLYHTCYCLSGLAAAQRTPFSARTVVVGDAGNILEPVHPVHNVTLRALDIARR